ncbi:MAG: hypothetical protein M3P01_06385 [Actinomycetota bacterium]|nr:hypothetical protein [Actinomycetota bacterium]
MTSRGRLHIVRIDGDPTLEERGEIEAVVTKLIRTEQQEGTPSLWARSGRAQSRRLGMFDYRDRFSQEDAWRLSVRMPFGGREYPGRNGRGDAK